MRLLHHNDDGGWDLVHFDKDDEVPRYAILSHTGLSEEINFGNMESCEPTRDFKTAS